MVHLCEELNTYPTYPHCGLGNFSLIHDFTISPKEQKTWDIRPYYHIVVAMFAYNLQEKTETLNLNLVVWKYHSTRHSHCFSTLAVDCTFLMSKLIWTSFPLNNKPSINSRQPKMQIYMLVHTAKKCKIMYVKSSYWIWFSQRTETWRKGSFCGSLLGRFPGNRRSARAEFGERGNSVHLDGESIVLTNKKWGRMGVTTCDYKAQGCP